MTAKTLGLFATLLGVLLPVWQVPPSTQSRATAFGYQVGEERRYVLGPSESLSADEFAEWSIRFEGRRGVAQLAIFKLHHVRNEPVSKLASPKSGYVVRSETEATVSLNSNGFPEDLVFTVREQLFGRGEDVYTVRYSYDDGSFLKEVWTYDKDWSIRTPIANHRHLDRDVPAGLHLFLPSALHCMGGYSDLTRDALPENVRAACDESDPAFANPGLLSVAVSRLFASDTGELEVLFFTPLGPDVYPGLRPNVRFGSATGGSPAGASVGIAGRWMEGEIDRLLDLQRYFESARMRQRGPERIEVGPREVQAHRLDVGGTLREVYVDDNGKVLRVNIDPHPTHRSPRWIRLLFPSEY